jgi:hypothetical protein
VARVSVMDESCRVRHRLSTSSGENCFVTSLSDNRLGNSDLAHRIFRNRIGDRIKILYWGGHSLCLLCQRLEAGRYLFPDAPAGASRVELSACALQMILDGIDVSRTFASQALALTAVLSCRREPPGMTGPRVGERSLPLRGPREGSRTRD